MNRNRLMAAWALMLPLSSCAVSQDVPIAAAPGAEDPVAQAATILAAAADPTLDAKARAPLLARLDQLSVQSALDNPDDPLPSWRSEAADAGLTLPPVRGRVLGPAYRSGWLEPGKTQSMEQLFLAGTKAQIILTSPDRGPLALQIRDRDQNTICQQSGPPPGRCQWVAIFTQRYQIELSNPGTVRRRYFLVTN